MASSHDTKVPLESGGTAERIVHVTRAFYDDGFNVRPGDTVVANDRVGIRARHRTAVCGDTNEPKSAYYVEGSPFERGFLLGRLAEAEIERMTETFIDRVVGAMVREVIHGERMDFTGSRGPRLLPIHGLLIELVHDMIRRQAVLADVPIEVHEEIRGIVAGCREAAAARGGASRVTEEELWVLNAGLDCILSRAYTGLLLPARLAPHDLEVPIACNGFAILNAAAADGALFGRDYMFPTGGIFNRVACHLIRCPAPTDTKSLPTVSMTAPGIVGSITAMNTAGVAAGVDVAVGANCNPRRPGFNSLLLAFRCIERGRTAEEAVAEIIRAQRGVTWNYIVAASGPPRDRACVVEAGASTNTLPFADYPDEHFRDLLPDADFVADHPSADLAHGAMVRWEDYYYPSDYAAFNRPLFRRHGRRLHRDAFAADGRINRTPEEENCPDSLYFAPLRGRTDEVLLTTNHFVIPEIRLCSMHPWAKRAFRARVNDSQWRYDELNRRILRSIEERGPVSFEQARGLIRFLAPSGDYPTYYRRNPKNEAGTRTIVFGSTSVCELKRGVMQSQYGYYGDGWVQTRLANYVPPTDAL